VEQVGKVHVAVFGWRRSEAITGKLKTICRHTFKRGKEEDAAGQSQSTTNKDKALQAERVRREWVNCQQSIYSKKFEAREVGTKGSTLRGQSCIVGGQAPECKRGDEDKGENRQQ
jgi:hypothetical protein